MTTVVNNPTPQNDSNGPMSMIIGVIALFVFGYLFFMYGIPALKQVQLGAPQINVPSKIEVNVKQEK